MTARCTPELRVTYGSASPRTTKGVARATRVGVVRFPYVRSAAVRPRVTHCVWNSPSNASHARTRRSCSLAVAWRRSRGPLPRGPLARGPLPRGIEVFRQVAQEIRDLGEACVEKATHVAADSL